MRHILASMVLVVLLFPALALGATIGDLVERDGLHYKKSTDVPFTGEVRGKEQGSIRNGKKDGPWIRYHDNGRIEEKGTYKDGKKDGLYTFHNEGDGQCAGTCHFHGTAGQYWTGTFKDGEKVEYSVLVNSPNPQTPHSPHSLSDFP